MILRDAENTAIGLTCYFDAVAPFCNAAWSSETTKKKKIGVVLLQVLNIVNLNDRRSLKNTAASH
eukprot:m.3944 g.3944  ORF g.3944 m.3944 type:complete len:65 (+) comp1678_c0_seq1:150-344(+)